MKSKSKLFAVLGGIAVLIGGYFGLSTWAANEAKRQVRITLIEADLDRDVRYSDVTASLLGGSITLHDVILRDPLADDLFIVADRLVISDIERDQDQIIGLRAKLEGLELPVMDAAKQPRGQRGLIGILDPESAYQLVGMGYAKLSGSLELSGKLDPDLRVFESSIVADLDNFHSLHLDVSLSGVDINTLAALWDAKSLASSRSFLGVLDQAPAILNAASRLELQNLVVSVRDRGFRERFLADYAEAQLITDGPENVVVTVSSLVKRNVSSSLMQDRVDQATANDMAAKVADYVETGGELIFTTRIKQPIPLFERGGLLGIRPAPVTNNLGHFLALADAQLER